MKPPGEPKKLSNSVNSSKDKLNNYTELQIVPKSTLSLKSNFNLSGRIGRLLISLEGTGTPTGDFRSLLHSRLQFRRHIFVEMVLPFP
jgi:hypothetical protein